jgi:hypothetical protein
MSNDYTIISNDYTTIFIFLFLLIVLSFFFFKMYQPQIEGMKNNDKENNNTGHGINSTKYDEQLKINHHNMKDKLNIKENRSNYENIIIDMSDYLDGLMLNELLSINPSSITSPKIMETIENINKMSSGKQNLNKIMKYLDDN